MTVPILSVRDLTIRYRTKEAVTYAADHVSFELQRGKVLALIGESGAGKTTAAMSILKLLPPQTDILSGEVHFDGQDLLATDDRSLRTIRGSRIAMISRTRSPG